MAKKAKFDPNKKVPGGNPSAIRVYKWEPKAGAETAPDKKDLFVTHPVPKRYKYTYVVVRSAPAATDVSGDANDDAGKLDVVDTEAALAVYNMGGDWPEVNAAFGAPLLASKKVPPKKKSAAKKAAPKKAAPKKAAPKKAAAKKK